ncbi:MAG: S8 family serine peptidase, partial [Planctomycetota bacterium]
MSINEANSSCATIRGAMAAAIVTVAVLAVGALKAEQVSGRESNGLGRSRNSRPVSGPKSAYVPGEVIVKLREGRAGGVGLLSLAGSSEDKGALLRLKASYGLSDDRPVFRGFNGRENKSATRQGTKETRSSSIVRRPSSYRSYLFRTDRDVRAVCAELGDDPDIEYAQPNYIYERCAEPNDPEFPDQYAHQLIQMPDAWDISTGSRDVVVAVLDTGVDVNHPDLKDNIWVNGNEIPNNGVDDDNNGFVDDVSGWNFEHDNNDVTPEFDWWIGIEAHGTLVAGVIAAKGNNGIDVCGVNWTSSIMALRLSLDVTSAEVAAGLDYATANGANVVNMSFGSSDFAPEGDPAVKAAIDNAYAQGILLVASAGNDDTALPHYPAAYYNVMAVSST